MEITPVGLIFIAAGLLAFALRPVWLLSLAIFSVIFQASAVFNLTSPVEYGLSPYYFCASLLFLKQLPFEKRFAGYYWLRVRPWIYIFFAIVFFGTLVFPFLFSGMAVYLPRGGIDEQYGNLSSLEFGFGNLSQIFYLILNLAVLRYFFIVRKVVDIKIVYASVEWTATVLLLVAAYQWMHINYEWPFPFDLIYSNAQIRAAMPDSLVGYTRIFGTFPEPSYCAAFLAFYFFYSLRPPGALDRNKLGMRLKSAFALVILALTGSTTGYLAALITGCLFICFDIEKRTISIIYGAAIIGCLSIGFLLWASTPTGEQLLASAIFEKSDTLSTIHRLAADERAFEILFETAGLGAGLGSNRASSFFASALSNIGVIGMAVFLVLLYIQISWILKVGKSRSRAGLTKRSASWGLLATLIAMGLGIPDLNWPVFWIVWGVTMLTVVDADHIKGTKKIKRLLYGVPQMPSRINSLPIQG